jgi:effector-binding domain-containing protein
MIVRISGEDQYELADDDAERLGELEGEVIAIVESGQEEGFESSYQALLDFVREAGSPVGDDELEGSDVILPPADITFAEAGEEFTGEGLIPD